MEHKGKNSTILGLLRSRCKDVRPFNRKKVSKEALGLFYD
eukprot:UN08483